jgi:hypothetical protein
VYLQAQYETLAAISVSHLYNLRRSSGYRRINGPLLQHNHATAIPIGERRKPNPQGQPGYLRVDFVRKGDFEGVEGVYLINAADEITQFEFVGAVARISEVFLLPMLASMLEFFRFAIRGFHSRQWLGVHQLSSGQTARQTAPRSHQIALPQQQRQRLPESKNASVVREHLGYAHIPSHHAQAVKAFSVEQLTPYLNFDRPCFFARTRTNAKGKIKKFYPYADMMTPYDKLQVAARRPHLSQKRTELLDARRARPEPDRQRGGCAVEQNPYQTLRQNPPRAKARLSNALVLDLKFVLSSTLLNPTRPPLAQAHFTFGKFSGRWIVSFPKDIE